MNVIGAIKGVFSLLKSDYEIGTLTPPSGFSSDAPRDVVKKILKVAISLMVIAAVFVVIWGGFNYITAQGDSEKIRKAGSTIMYGLIGLGIAIAAGAIVGFMFSKLSGSSIPTI